MISISEVWWEARLLYYDILHDWLSRIGSPRAGHYNERKRYAETKLRSVKRGH